MSNYLPCSTWDEKLALRQEDLSPSERIELEAHLQECPACSKAQADYNTLITRLRALPSPPMKPLPKHLPQQEGSEPHTDTSIAIPRLDDAQTVDDILSDHPSPAPPPLAIPPQVTPTVLPTRLRKNPARLRLTPPQVLYTQAVVHNEITRPAIAMAQRKKSKRGLLVGVFPIILLLVAVVAIPFFSHNSSSADGNGNKPPITVGTLLPTATPTLTPDQLQVEATIGLFYADINTQNYESAYELLQPSSTPADMVQSGNCSASYRAFLNGYAQTKQTDITFTSISPPNEQKRYTVQFIIRATEYLPTGIRKSVYYVEDSVKQTSSGWQIVLSGSYAPSVLGVVTPSTTTGTAPPDQPQTIVQLYLGALTTIDYPLAYNILSQNYRTSYPYCDFVVTHTDSHYTVQTVSPATPQADGTSLVTATYSVTPPVSTGQRTNTVQENFTLTQEQGVWKIVSIVSSHRGRT